MRKELSAVRPWLACMVLPPTKRAGLLLGARRRTPCCPKKVSLGCSALVVHLRLKCRLPRGLAIKSRCCWNESRVSQAVQHSLVTFTGFLSACCSMAVTVQRDSERDCGTCVPSREKMFHSTHACACDGSPQYLQQRSRAACSQLL